MYCPKCEIEVEGGGKYHKCGTLLVSGPPQPVKREPTKVVNLSLTHPRGGGGGGVSGQQTSSSAGRGATTTVTTGSQPKPQGTSFIPTPQETATKTAVTSEVQDGGITIEGLKAQYEKAKPLVEELSNSNPDRKADIAAAVKLVNEKLKGTNVTEAFAALKSLLILLKTLKAGSGSPSVSTPQGSSSGAQPKQPTPQQPTKPQPTPQQPTIPQPQPTKPQPQQATAQPLEDRKLREETQGLITILSHQDKLLPAPLLDFLTKLPSKNKEIDNETDVTKRCNQRRSLRDQLLYVQNGIVDYLTIHERTTRAYTTATSGIGPEESLERKLYDKLAGRFEAHNALDISEIFDDIGKLDTEFAEFNTNKANLAATYQKAKSLCEKISKALPLRKKEFDEKLENGSVTDLTALVSELEKLEKEGPEEASKAMNIVTKTSNEDLNKIDVTERIKLLTNLRRGTAIQKGVLQKARNKLYRTMKMDKDFEQADSKMREEVLNNVEKLIKSTDAKKKWPTMDDKQKEEFLQKVLEIQCAEMKKQMPNFKAPKVTTFSEAAAEVEKDKLTTESGYFSSGKLYINDKKESFKDFAGVINTVIHENTHNYQDQLVGMLERGELENDPRKNQAILFRLNEGEYQDTPKRGNYKGKDSEYDEAYEAYEKQPRELHAMTAGNDAKARFQG